MSQRLQAGDLVIFPDDETNAMGVGVVLRHELSEHPGPSWNLDLTREPVWACWFRDQGVILAWTYSDEVEKIS